jgi:hypothetical protein
MDWETRSHTRRPGFIVRFGQGIGQIMIIPNDITNPDPPDGDLPYAGSLTCTLNWQSFNRQTARTFQITMGVLGEASYAGDVQKFLHKIHGVWGKIPKGGTHSGRQNRL